MTPLKTNDREIKLAGLQAERRAVIEKLYEALHSGHAKKNHQNVNLNTKSHCDKQQKPSNQLRCTGARRIQRLGFPPQLKKAHGDRC